MAAAFLFMVHKLVNTLCRYFEKPGRGYTKLSVQSLFLIGRLLLNEVKPIDADRMIILDK